MTATHKATHARTLRACRAWRGRTKFAVDPQMVMHLLQGAGAIARDASLMHYTGLEKLEKEMQEQSKFVLQYLSAVGTRYIPQVISASPAFERAIDALADHMPKLMQLAYKNPVSVAQDIAQDHAKDAIVGAADKVVTDLTAAATALRQSKFQRKAVIKAGGVPPDTLQKLNALLTAVDALWKIGALHPMTFADNYYQPGQIAGLAETLAKWVSVLKQTPGVPAGAADRLLPALPKLRKASMHLGSTYGKDLADVIRLNVAVEVRYLIQRLSAH